MTKTHKIHFSELSKSSLAFYTGKWFLIWSFKFFTIGLMAATAIMVFLMATCGGKDQSDKSP